jgi:hypothetical protein
MIDEVDLKSLWKDLDSYSDELDKEKSTLQEVWVKIAEIKAQNESEIALLLSKDEFDFLDPDTEIVINVGGQIFEVDVSTLTRDPFSILAGLCRRNPVIPPDEDGVFFIDRDWWLFRHILSFLRSNILPNEIEALKELYVEASYYRLESLLHAIEDIPVDQVSNLSPQLAVTWTGARDESVRLRRPAPSQVLDATLFPRLSGTPIFDSYCTIFVYG